MDWISVEDRLPDDGDDCLCIQDGTSGIDYFLGHYERYSEGGAWVDDEDYARKDVVYYCKIIPPTKYLTFKG